MIEQRMNNMQWWNAHKIYHKYHKLEAITQGKKTRSQASNW